MSKAHVCLAILVVSYFKGHLEVIKCINPGGAGTTYALLNCRTPMKGR
jgi:hypothetical protein